MENRIANTSKEASRESFWSLLSEEKNNYTICIPRIQRDYAQGREEPEVEQIRKTFINAIFDSLRNRNELDINFIYGNVDSKDEEKVFIPIDGQQRLTTLFLLHWYFATWAGALDDSCKETLGRFKYETRFITGEFCNRLVYDVNVDLKNLDGKLSDVIKDYYWFFSTFYLDATIKAMLVMLDDIHKIVKAMDDNSVVDDFFDLLTSDECPVTFLFLNIEDIGLTDEIYIKMNARGKALTRFENFKAQLTAYLSGYDEDFSQRFIGKINGEWSQFFWNEEYRPLIQSTEDRKVSRRSTIFDDQIMNLFRFIMTNENISNVDIGDENSETKYRVRSILGGLSRESDFQFVNHLFADEFRSVQNYTTENANVDIRVFRFIEKLLDIMSKRKAETGNIYFTDNTLYDRQFINEEEYFKRQIRSVSEKALSYEDQVLMYALFCFLVKYANDDNSFDKSKELTEWMRVIYNLAHNTLYNTIDDYYRSIRRVKSLVESDYAIDILGYAATLLRKNYRQGSGFGFVDNQMMEECIKANLMLSSDKWKQRIVAAEHSFLESQITSLFVFSGIRDMYETEIREYEDVQENKDKHFLPGIDSVLSKAKSEPSYLNAFDEYLAKINLIFDEDEIKPELEADSVFRRALLTFGGADSYLLPPRSTTICFLDATDRERSFKRLLRGDYAKMQYFKELLDKLSTDDDVVTQLNQIIGDFSIDENNRWKKYFVEMPEILQCMRQNKDCVDPDGNIVFRDPKRFISKRSADQILLLERTMTTSINREYYSYVLFLKARKEGLKVGYFTTFNENTEKYLTFNNDHGEAIQVLYMPDEQSPDKAYKYIARDSQGARYKGNLESMLDYIKQTIE